MAGLGIASLGDPELHDGVLAQAAIRRPRTISVLGGRMMPSDDRVLPSSRWAAVVVTTLIKIAAALGTTPGALVEGILNERE